MAQSTRLHTLHRPWAVWLALCVAMFMALAPTLSHTLAWGDSDGANFIEICTATGPRLVRADTAPISADSPAGPESAKSLTHCPFCLQTTDRVAWINPPLTYPFLVQDGKRESPVWQAFLYVNPNALAPPPRGPPWFKVATQTVAAYAYLAGSVA